MRAARLLAIVVAGLVLLVVVALISAWLLINPNDYKPRIQAAVKAATGRELKLPGDIKLSVFPWIALELGPASLGNPPGFGSEPFLAFEHAAVRVKLWPLVHRQLEVGRVEIDGLDLRLRKDAAGRGNWESQEPSPEAGTPEKRSLGGTLKRLAGIHVRSGTVSYQDTVVSDIALETGTFSDRAVIPVSFSFSAKIGATGTASVDAKFSLSIEESSETLHLAALSVSGLARAESAPEVHWELSAPAIEVNLKQQTLNLPSFAFTYAGARISGHASAAQVLDAPKATGSLKLEPVALRDFLPRLGMAPPRVHDPHALAEFAASSGFGYDSTGLRLSTLQVTLDDTHLRGSAALVGTPKALKFDLSVDGMDLNRYLADPQAQEPAPKPAPKSAQKPMEAGGTLSIASLHVSSFDLTGVRVTLVSHEGVIRLAPLAALIDGGRFSGEVSLDERAAVPPLSVEAHLAGIDVSRLVAGGPLKGRISGHGNVNIKATARGAEADAIMKTLNGSFDANLAGGALEGLDLGFVLAQAESLLAHQGIAGAQNTNRTPFDAFKMSAQITNGLATTRDILISSPVLKVKGQGTISLPSKGLDLALLASLLKSPKSVAAEVPVRVTGTYLDPTVRPDLEGLAKGAIKQKLQDALGDKLKGLFGKP